MHCITLRVVGSDIHFNCYDRFGSSVFLADDEPVVDVVVVVVDDDAAELGGVVAAPLPDVDVEVDDDFCSLSL
jgi:hypothetical protein